MEVTCLICNKKENVNPYRAKKYKTCSIDCLSKFFKRKPNTSCNFCKKEIYVKPCKVKRSTKMGNFCSTACVSNYQKKYFLADNNPNFKNIQRCHDGYKMIHIPNIGSYKEHIYVALSVLNINHIPKGYHVHHRDGDRNNNTPINLVVLSISDHIWLHKEFGNSGLWAYCNNKITLDTLLEWTKDKEKAFNLLPLSLEKQIGVFKSDELLGKPVEVNQQPS